MKKNMGIGYGWLRKFPRGARMIFVPI